MEHPVLAYIVIAACIGLAAYAFTRRMKAPPPPSHLDDLEAELRQAQRDGLIELKRAEIAAALAEVHNERARRLITEIEDERTRTGVRRGQDVPSKGPIQTGAHVHA